MRDLESVRDRFAHQLPPGASVAEILRFLAARALKSTPENRPSRGQKSPVKEDTESPVKEQAEPPTTEKSSLPAPVVASRYIPVQVKKIVWVRDAGRCAYIAKETGRKCESPHRVQIDHIHPHALGGGNTPENLRLLCAAHNQLEARRIFALM